MLMKLPRFSNLWIALLLFLVLLMQRNLRETNILAVQVVHALLEEGETPTDLTSTELDHSCNLLWLAVVVDHYQRASIPEQKINALFTKCSAKYVDLLHNLEPQNAVAAEKSIVLKPDVATSWFWVAEVRGGYQNYNFHRVTQENWREIAALLERGLALAPHDGLRWRLLGDVLRPHKPYQAIQAYLQSCFNGDPGYNGCSRAGTVAEELGDYRNAIRYYRYSRWQGALRRADELERKILGERSE